MITYQTNQLNQNALFTREHYKNINQDFWICKFEMQSESQKYDYSLIDEVKQDLPHVESVVYLRGKHFYALFRKENFTDQEDLESTIENLIGDSEEVIYNIVLNLHDRDNGIDKRHLTQLLLNLLPSFSNSKNTAKSNITGGLYVVVKAEKSKKKAEKYDKPVTWKYVTIKVELDYSFHLMLYVKTFSTILLRKHMKFEERKTDFDALPKYEILSNDLRTMRRVGYGGTYNNPENIYVNAVRIGQKNTVPYIDFASYDRFIKSKCGILYLLLEEANEKLGRYMKLSFKDMPFDDNKIEFDSSISRKVSKEIKEFISKYPIVLNLAQSLQSDKEVEQTVNDLKELLTDEDRNYKLSEVRMSEIEPSSINVRFIHHKEYYEKHKIKDEYLSKNFLLHHLTVEGFGVKLYKETKDRKTGKTVKVKVKKIPAIDVIFKEMRIKQDVIQNRITLLDWKYGGWKFMIREKAEIEENKHSKNKVYDYFILEVDSEGKMVFSSCLFGEVFKNKEHERLKTVFQREVKNSWKQQETPSMMVVSEDNTINIVYDTPKFTVQEIQEIGNFLKFEEQEHEFNKEEVLKIIDSFMSSDKCKNSEKSKLLALRSKIEDYKNSISKQGLIKLMDKADILKRGANHTQYRLCQFFTEETGQVIKNFFRSKEEKAALLGSKLDIYYHQHSSDVALYFVGEKSAGIQSKFQNATNIRIVRTVYSFNNSSKQLVFDQLLETMNVDFVKHGQLTVFPFPLKYLREYIRLNK